MSLLRVLILFLLVSLLGPALVVGVVEAVGTFEASHREMNQTMEQAMSFLALGLEEYIWNYDKEGGQPLLDKLMQDSRIVGVVVTETSGTLYLENVKPDRRIHQSLFGASEINRRGMTIGMVKVELETETFNRKLVNNIMAEGLKLILQTALSLGLIILVFQYRFLRPLKRLEEQSSKLAAQDLVNPFHWDRDDELGRLGHSLEQTRAKLKTLFEDLEKRNANLVAENLRRQATERELLEFRANLQRLVENRTRELKTSNRELEAFSYSVSHDLRAPLRSIDGFSQILLDDYAERLDDEARDYLNRMRRAVHRMSSLIDDLLNLARLSRTEVARTEIDLETLAQEIMAELRETDKSRVVNFFVEGDCRTSADPRLIRIVLQNLLGNAWKYSVDKDPSQITLAAHWQGGVKMFRVEDNGIGFDMQYAAKLFQPFQRLHNADEFPGNGVGLALVQRAVERHGGQVLALGTPGQGSRFYFTLEKGPDLPTILNISLDGDQ